MGCLTAAPSYAAFLVAESSSPARPLRSLAESELEIAPRYRRGSNSCVTDAIDKYISFINHEPGTTFNSRATPAHYESERQRRDNS